jgi:hypothetical protein
VTDERIKSARRWIENYDPESEDDIDHDDYDFVIELLSEALDEIDRLKAEVANWKRRDDHRYWGVLDF